MYPDIVQLIFSAEINSGEFKSFIIDTEIVGFDVEKQQILSFQILTTRARKNVSMTDDTVQICLFAFDILQVNGRNVL
jgi:DNA ligase-1